MVVKESFRVNGIDVAGLCADMLNAMTEGRSESVPVVVLAGARGGEGKSFFLKALFSISGVELVFKSPVKGGFPLVDLPGAKVVFLDEYRFNEEVLPLATQCLWMDGSAVTINRAQNIKGQKGHYTYEGTAPIFATTKAADLARLAALAADDPRTGVPWSGEASMIYRRLKIHWFHTRIPKPPPKVPFCGHCFAYMILNGQFPPIVSPASAPAGVTPLFGTPTP